MKTCNQGPDLKAIKPKGPNSKYSRNLHQWMKARSRPNLIKVFTDPAGRLTIGYLTNRSEVGVWLEVAPLTSVLRSGRKSRLFSFLVGPIFAMTEVEGFWERYKAEGVCAIDPEHKMCFAGDESRWFQDGDTRTCQWCGNRTERLETKTVAATGEEWKIERQGTPALRWD